MEHLHKEFKFTSHRTQFFGQCWQPETPDAVVVLVHGFGEHSGRYSGFVVEKLLAANLAVITYDNFGHGKSEGKRGHCPSYDALMFVLGKVIRKAEDDFLNLPVFLYGHSMGGNLVLNYTLRNDHQLCGVVATSPYLRLAFNPPKWKMIAGKMLLNIAPSVTLPAEIDPKTISKDEKEVQKYIEDPLVHDKVSPMFSFPIMEAGEWAIENAHVLNTPTLLVHGEKDQLIDHRATIEFDKNTKSSELHLFKEGFHELHNDIEKEKTLATITNWIQSVLKTND